MSGIGRQLFCIDICGKEITDADVMKTSRNWIKNSNANIKEMAWQRSKSTNTSCKNLDSIKSICRYLR